MKKEPNNIIAELLSKKKAKQKNMGKFNPKNQKKGKSQITNNVPSIMKKQGRGS